MVPYLIAKCINVIQSHLTAMRLKIWSRCGSDLKPYNLSKSMVHYGNRDKRTQSCSFMLVFMFCFVFLHFCWFASFFKRATTNCKQINKLASKRQIHNPYVLLTFYDLFEFWIIPAWVKSLQNEFGLMWEPFFIFLSLKKKNWCGADTQFSVDYLSTLWLTSFSWCRAWGWFTACWSWQGTGGWGWRRKDLVC